MGSVALVFAGGDPPPADALRNLPPADLVIAADSGLEHAVALGFAVDLVVGDLDSVDPAAIDAAVAAGAAVERHPEAKDATDLELALLARARPRVHARHRGRRTRRSSRPLPGERAPARVLRTRRRQVEARLGDAQVFVVRDEHELHGEAGDLCTLLPLGGPALGVRTEGLRFPLRGETLEPGSTRGVSNELLSSVARVSLVDGVLLAILPDPGKAEQ